MRQPRPAATVLLVCAIATSACASAGAPTATAPLPPGAAASAGVSEPSAATPPPSPEEYVVQAGDTLLLKFYYHPDHDQEAIVRPDGKIALGLIGEIPAAGVTPARLALDLEQRYARNLREPRIAVSVKAMNQNRVYVGGEVNRPGFVAYRPGLTALQAMLEAGGPKDTAKVRDVVLLQRVGSEHVKASKVDLAKVLEEGQPSGDFALGPSDVLFVPKTTIAKVNQFVEQYILKVLPVRPGIGASMLLP
jgi:protein involved in polysaccharide export with SLBB domain